MWQPRVKHFTWGKCNGCQPIPECWTLIEKDKKKNLALVLGTSDWRLMIEEERRSKTEKRKKEQNGKEEEGKCR